MTVCSVPDVPSFSDLDGGLIVVFGCGEAGAEQIAAQVLKRSLLIACVIPIPGHPGHR